MSFLNSINIPGSALTAERFRMDIALQNLTHQNTLVTPEGGPYRRKMVIFEERDQINFDRALKDEANKLKGGGVRVSEIIESEQPLTPVYDPTHPLADDDGYVMYPNVNSAEEQFDLMAATRAYEANLTALNVIKTMAMKGLEIGK